MAVSSRARRSPVLLTVLTAVAAAQAPTELQQRIVREGSEHSQVMAFQETLCHDFGSRLTGSLAFDRAAEWARDQFAAMGLEAKLLPWGEWQVGWDREQWQGRIVEPTELELQVACPAWTGSTQGQARGTLVRMPGSAAEIAELQARAATDPLLWLFGALPKDDALRTPLQELLDAGKCLGIVQSATSTGWNDKRYPNQIRVFGDNKRAQRPFAERPRWAHAVVRDDQAVKLDELLAGKVPVIAEFELRNRWRPGPVKLFNVQADLRGSEHPDEMVIVCAHLDSWHQATGATDNGTGTCSTLEAARILCAAGSKPKRTIRFLLWGGEEQGLLGSRQYVIQNRTSMHKVSAVFNHDSGTNWAHSLTVAQSQLADMQPVVQPILALLKPPQAGHEGPVFDLNAVPVLQPAGGGSDHASFAAVGVPAFGWRLLGEVPYGRGWHSQWDTISIVVPPYQRHTATVIALVADGVANLDHLLSRQGVERAKPGGPVNAQLMVEAWLGVELDGLAVKAVSKDGLAAAAGVAAGDQFASVAGKPIEDQPSLLAALREAWAAEAAVIVQLRRGDQAIDAPLRR